MRKILLILALSGQLFGACHVVSKTGAGTKTGADWTNAAQFGVTSGFTGSTFVSGDSYYFQDEPVVTGTLSGVTVLNAAASPVPTVTRASGSFIVDGVTVGMRIKFSGFANFSNASAWFQVVSVGATVLGVADAGEALMTLPPTIMISESSTSGAVSYVARDTTNDYPIFTSTKTSVTLKKATAADHCTDTGWVVGTMGSGSAYFSGGATTLISLAASDVFDGAGRTDKTHGHGFVADCSQNTGFFFTCMTNADGVTIRYTEVMGQGLANNPISPNVYTITGATVTVASNILTITGMAAGAYTPLGSLVPGQQVKFTTAVVGAASFLGNKLVTVCDHALNASCVVPSSTQFSAAFTHADFGPDATSTGTNTIEVNISEAAISFNTRASMLAEYNYIHDTADRPITLGGNSNNNTFQNNVIARVYSSNAIHGGGIAGNQNNTTATFRDWTIRNNDFIDVSGTALVDTLTAGSDTPFTISTVAIDGSNVLTVTGSGVTQAFPIGGAVYFTGLTTATFLNGQVVRVISSSTTQFTASFTHALYGSAADTGKAITSNDNIQFYGNTISYTPNTIATGLGDGVFFCGSTTGNGACTNINYYNNTFDKIPNVYVIYFAGNYGSFTFQNNLVVDTTVGTIFPSASSTMATTDNKNTFLCLTGSSCYSHDNRVVGFDCVADECLPNSGTGNQSNPFTGASYPTSQTIFNLAAATTTGATIAFTDPSGVVAPQGGIYNRGAYEFSAVASSYTVTASCAGNANGTIIGSAGATMNATCTAGVCSGTCSESVTAGATVTYTATATTGSLAGFTGGICNGSPCSPTINAPLTLTATFQTVPTCTLTCVSNNINSPATVSCTAALTGLSSNYLWELTEPINGNVIAACNTDGCKTGATGNLQYTGSGIYTLIATGNGVLCTASTQPLNINTGAGSAAH